MSGIEPATSLLVVGHAGHLTKRRWRGERLLLYITMKKKTIKCQNL